MTSCRLVLPASGTRPRRGVPACFSFAESCRRQVGRGESPAPEDSAEFVYAPRQFLSVQVPDAGTGSARCYSLASSPHADSDLKFTVKRVLGGAARIGLRHRRSEGRARGPSARRHLRSALAGGIGGAGRRRQRHHARDLDRQVAAVRGLEGCLCRICESRRGFGHLRRRTAHRRMEAKSEATRRSATPSRSNTDSGRHQDDGTARFGLPFGGRHTSQASPRLPS